MDLEHERTIVEGEVDRLLLAPFPTTAVRRDEYEEAVAPFSFTTMCHWKRYLFNEMKAVIWGELNARPPLNQNVLDWMEIPRVLLSWKEISLPVEKHGMTVQEPASQVGLAYDHFVEVLFHYYQSDPDARDLFTNEMLSLHAVHPETFVTILGRKVYHPVSSNGGGFTVVAAVDMKPGTFLGEYLGNVYRQSRKRIPSEYAQTLESRLDSGERERVTLNVVLDAKARGNILRFVNDFNGYVGPKGRSVDDGNASFFRFLFKGIPRIGLVTTRMVNRTDEILVSYGGAFWYWKAQAGLELVRKQKMSLQKQKMSLQYAMEQLQTGEEQLGVLKENQRRTAKSLARRTRRVTRLKMDIVGLNERMNVCNDRRTGCEQEVIRLNSALDQHEKSKAILQQDIQSAKLDANWLGEELEKTRRAAEYGRLENERLKENLAQCMKQAGTAVSELGLAGRRISELQQSSQREIQKERDRHAAIVAELKQTAGCREIVSEETKVAQSRLLFLEDELRKQKTVAEKHEHDMRNLISEYRERETAASAAREIGEESIRILTYRVQAEAGRAGKLLVELGVAESERDLAIRERMESRKEYVADISRINNLKEKLIGRLREELYACMERNSELENRLVQQREVAVTKEVRTGEVCAKRVRVAESEVVNLRREIDRVPGMIFETTDRAVDVYRQQYRDDLQQLRMWMNLTGSELTGVGLGDSMFFQNAMGKLESMISDRPKNSVSGCHTAGLAGQESPGSVCGSATSGVQHESDAPEKCSLTSGGRHCNAISGEEERIWDSET